MCELANTLFPRARYHVSPCRFRRGPDVKPRLTLDLPWLDLFASAGLGLEFNSAFNHALHILSQWD